MNYTLLIVSLLLAPFLATCAAVPVPIGEQTARGLRSGSKAALSSDENHRQLGSSWSFGNLLCK
jgi:hypothetical protein